MFQSISKTKNKKQHIRDIIWHTKCDHWTHWIFEDQTDQWERDSFSVGSQPIQS